MEHSYWLKRQTAAFGMARRARTAQSRLIHYDLAGRYGVMAARAVRRPCLPGLSAHCPGGER